VSSFSTKWHRKNVCLKSAFSMKWCNKIICSVKKWCKKLSVQWNFFYFDAKFPAQIFCIIFSLNVFLKAENSKVRSVKNYAENLYLKSLFSETLMRHYYYKTKLNRNISILMQNFLNQLILNLSKQHFLHHFLNISASFQTERIFEAENSRVRSVKNWCRKNVCLKSTFRKKN